MFWNRLLALLCREIFNKNTIVFKKPLGRSSGLFLDQVTCNLCFWVPQCWNKEEIDGKD